MDGIHDLGGMHGFGAVVTPGGDAPYHERWEARVFALHVLAGVEGLTGRPGGRATRERMPPAEYLAASYYERWLWSAERGLERTGTVQPGEVERMMERLAAGEPAPRRDDPAQARRAVAELRRGYPAEPVGAARFAPGDRVRVRRMRPTGHTRCPRYVRGAVGEVARVHFADRLPDLAVHGERVAPEAVYAVRFRSDELWGRGPEPPWTVSVDLWESYLEAPGADHPAPPGRSAQEGAR
ncbi:MAG TPA: nitrile hydratase subunit beta [Actinomycetes bacterium]